jgi:hypothetical protein
MDIEEVSIPGIVHESSELIVSTVTVILDQVNSGRGAAVHMAV